MFDEMVNKINEDARVETNKQIGELLVENKYLNVAVNEFKLKLQELGSRIQELEAQEMGNDEEDTEVQE